MSNPSRTILITGASSGIGAALALLYAAPGITLILTARNIARLTDIATQCRARGAQVITANLDVREKAALAEFILRADDATPIDLVIANAGVSAGGFDGDEMAAQVDQLFDVNVNGVLNTIHPLIPRMVARKSGHIAVMASLASLRPLPSAPAYSASKAAVRFYGDALYNVLAPENVAVSVICPGWITTPLTDKNDFPMPLLMSAERAAAIIKRGLTHRKRRIAFPKRLYYPLLILAALPLVLTDPLFARMPKKRLKT